MFAIPFLPCGSRVKCFLGFFSVFIPGKIPHPNEEFPSHLFVYLNINSFIQRYIHSFTTHSVTV